MHQGLDYAAPTGTPVSASMPEPSFWPALCISKATVSCSIMAGAADTLPSSFGDQGKQGERIARGKEIGLSGGTGRATGPHLHLAVRWQGVYLNPATL